MTPALAQYLGVSVRKGCENKAEFQETQSSGTCSWHVKAHKKLLIAPVTGLEKRGFGFLPDVLGKTPKTLFGQSNIR